MVPGPGVMPMGAGGGAGGGTAAAALLPFFRVAATAPPAAAAPMTARMAMIFPLPPPDLAPGTAMLNWVMRVRAVTPRKETFTWI